MRVMVGALATEQIDQLNSAMVGYIRFLVVHPLHLVWRKCNQQ
jgi:hypothetical protein